MFEFIFVNPLIPRVILVPTGEIIEEANGTPGTILHSIIGIDTSLISYAIGSKELNHRKMKTF